MIEPGLRVLVVVEALVFPFVARGAMTLFLIY